LHAFQQLHLVLAQPAAALAFVFRVGHQPSAAIFDSSSAALTGLTR
jgi:hypothetical protein